MFARIACSNKHQDLFPFFLGEEMAQQERALFFIYGNRTLVNCRFQMLRGCRTRDFNTYGLSQHAVSQGL